MTTVDTSCRTTETPTDIDIDALREKYARERLKRLRDEGSQQYIELKDEYAKFYETDPHTPRIERDAITEEIDVAVLGGGFAGLISAARIKQQGVDDIRVIEMGGDFGGVWYWNRYPGVQCDNDSYCYIPLLEELDYIPKQRYADGAEIFEHCQRIGKHFGLYESALFQTQVRELHWDDESSRWLVSTDRGDLLKARYIVMGAGPFNKPKLPGIPGLEKFQGHSFHSSRWEYDYTGGDRDGAPLDKLADKRVAVIGTGATAVQIVPYLGKYAKELVVFQRTPSCVDARNNRPTDPEWAKTLEPGWQKKRQRNFQQWAVGVPLDGRPDLVCDFWTEIGRNMSEKIKALPDPAAFDASAFMEMREREDYQVMERLRRRIEALVDDPDTAEALKPYYRFLCKRPCSNDNYLQTFNRPNVTLVDVSASKGVERATEKGLVANGTEYEFDCIIYASGFEITTEISRRYGIDKIEGRGRLSLFDHWGEGYKTLHGMTTTEFPNAFFTGMLQGGLAASISAIYEQQGEHIAHVIKAAMDRGAKTVEPSADAVDEWVTTIRETALPTGGFEEACTPGYYNNEGGGGGEGIKSHIGEPYGPGFYAFDALLKDWRDTGELAGLVLET